MAYKVYSFDRGQLREEELDDLAVIPVRNSPAVSVPAQPISERQSNTKTIRIRAQWPVSGHRMVTDGAEYVSHSNSFDANRVLGMSLNAAAAGDVVTVAVLGYVSETTWNLIPDLPVYLGEDGYITQTPPESGFLLVVGVAISPTSLYVDVGEPIFLTE